MARNLCHVTVSSSRVVAAPVFRGSGCSCCYEDSMGEDGKVAGRGCALSPVWVAGARLLIDRSCVLLRHERKKQRGIAQERAALRLRRMGCGGWGRRRRRDV